MEPIICCVQKFKSVINHRRVFFANLDDYSVTKTDMRNFFVERLEGIKTGMRCQKTSGTRPYTLHQQNSRVQVLQNNGFNSADKRKSSFWNKIGCNGTFRIMVWSQSVHHFSWMSCQVIHTIRKVKFLSKNSILTKPQHFHEFFTQSFFDNFSREIKVVNS